MDGAASPLAFFKPGEDLFVRHEAKNQKRSQQEKPCPDFTSFEDCLFGMARIDVTGRPASGGKSRGYPFRFAGIARSLPFPGGEARGYVLAIFKKIVVFGFYHVVHDRPAER